MKNGNDSQIKIVDDVETFLHSPHLLEEFGLLIRNEIASDDQSDGKMARLLLDAYLRHPEIVDDIMMTLCGWNIKSLMEKV